MKVWVLKLRLYSGLVMLAFLVMHLLNLALALHSVALADAAGPYLMGIWYNPVGGALFTLALLYHMALALITILKRRTLSMTRDEAIQFLTGFAIPPLLIFHVVMVQYGDSLIASDLDYYVIIVGLWSFPIYGLAQVFGVIVSWTHGCIGLLTWLRLQPIWPRIALPVNLAVVAIPIAALLGFIKAERDINIERIENPERLQEVWAVLNELGEVFEQMVSARDTILTVLIGLFTAAVAVRLALFLRRKHKTAEIVHPGQRPIRTEIGLTILDASRGAGLPHAAACGGRGRCATCRVRVDDGAELLAPADVVELDILAKAGASPDVRLACQATVAAPGRIMVDRILPAYADAGDAASRRKSGPPLAASVEAAE